ncbi:MAG: HYR domain-containing protein [Promethearchaeota archaeon]
MKRRSLMKNSFFLSLFVLSVVITLNNISIPRKADPLSEINLQGLQNVFYRSIASTGGIANPPHNYLADARSTYMGYNVGKLGEISQYELQLIISNFLQEVTSSNGYDLYTFYDGHQTLESMYWGYQLESLFRLEQKTTNGQDQDIRLKIAEFAKDTYMKFGSYTYDFKELYLITQLYSQIKELKSLISPILLNFYVNEWIENKKENLTVSDIYYALESLKMLEEEEGEREFITDSLINSIKKELSTSKKVLKLSNKEIYHRLVILEEENPKILDIMNSNLRSIVLDKQDEIGGFSDKINTYRRDEGSIEATYWALEVLKKLPPEEIPAEETILEHIIKSFYQVIMNPFHVETKGKEIISYTKVPSLVGENIHQKEPLTIGKIPAKITATAPTITEVSLNGSLVEEYSTVPIDQGDSVTLEITTLDDEAASKNLSVAVDIQIPLDDIEIAIFNTSVYNLWLTVETQTNIAATIINNVQAKNITCYNYYEQTQLKEWMESKLENGFPDVLILMDYIPYDIWELKEEDSLIELWLENGNGLLFTGYYPFSYYITSFGSISGFYNDQLQYILDSNGVRRDRLGDYGYEQYLTPEGQQYLPSMGSIAGQYLYYSYGCSHHKGIDIFSDPWNWEAKFSKYPYSSYSYYDNYVLEHVSKGSYAQFYISSDNNLPRGDVISEYLNNWYTTHILSQLKAQTPQFLGDLAIFNTSSATGWVTLNEEIEITSYIMAQYPGNSFSFNYSQQTEFQSWIQERIDDERNDLLLIFDYTPQFLYSGQGDGSLAEQWLSTGNSIIWTGYQPFYYYLTTTGSTAGGYYSGLQYVLNASSSQRVGCDQSLTPLGAQFLPSMGTSIGEKTHYSNGGAGYIQYYGTNWDFPLEFTSSSDLVSSYVVYSDSFALQHINGGIYAQFYVSSDSNLPRAVVLNEFIQNWPYIENHYQKGVQIASSHSPPTYEHHIINITHAREMRIHFDNITLSNGDNISISDEFGSVLYELSDSRTDFWTPWFSTSYINISLMSDVSWGYSIDCVEVNRNGVILYNSSNGQHWFDFNFFDHSLIGNLTALITITDDEGLKDTFKFDFNINSQEPTIISGYLNTTSIFKYNESVLIGAVASDIQDGINIDVWAILEEPITYRTIELPLTWIGGTQFENTIEFNKTDQIGNWTVTFHAKDTDWLTSTDLQSTVLTVKGHQPKFTSVYLNGTLVEGQVFDLTQGGNFNITGIISDYQENMEDIELNIIFQTIPDIAIFNSSAASGWITLNDRKNITEYLLTNVAYKSALVVDYYQQNILVDWINANLYDEEDDILVLLDQVPALLYNTEKDDSLAEKWLENGNTIIYTGMPAFSQIIFDSGKIRSGGLNGFGDVFDSTDSNLGRFSGTEISTDFGATLFNTNVQYHGEGEICRSYLIGDWSLELPLTSQENNLYYTDSFILTHVNGGHYVQLFITDDIIPRKEAIENYINDYHIINAIEDSLVIPSRLPEIAIFNASRSSYISEANRMKIVSYVMENLTAQSISCFNYSRQTELLSWMKSRLYDNHLDILIIIDVFPELIWKGEEDGSIAEEWLENGNMIIFMGYFGFYYYISDSGSISSYYNGFYDVIDATNTGAGRYGYNYIQQTAYGMKYLPSLPFSYQANGMLSPYHLTEDWWLSEVFSQEEQLWTYKYYDSFCIKHKNGGAYVQLLTSSSFIFNNLNCGTLIEEFIENWLYRSYLHTMANYTGFETDHTGTYTEPIQKILNYTNTNTLKTRLFFSNLTLNVGDFLIISGVNGNLLANYSDSQSNFWTPWYNQAYLNITLTNNSGSWGYIIDQVETIIIPQLRYSSSNGNFEINLTLTKNQLLGNRSIVLITQNYDHLEGSFGISYSGISLAPKINNYNINSTQLFRINQTLELWIDGSSWVASVENAEMVAILIAPDHSQIEMILSHESGTNYRGTIIFNETEPIGTWRVIFTGYKNHHWTPWSECGYTTLNLLGQSPELTEIKQNNTIIDTGATITIDQDEELELQFNVADDDSDISDMSLTLEIDKYEPIQVLIFNSSNPNGWISLEERAEICSYLTENLENVIITILDYDQQDVFVSWMTERLNDGENDLVIFMDQVPSNVWAYQSDGSLAEQWLEAGNSILWTGYQPFYYYTSSGGSTYSNGRGLYYVIDGTTSSLGGNSYWTIPLEYVSTTLPSLRSYYGRGNSYIDHSSWLGSQWSTHAQFNMYTSDHRYSDSHVLQHENGGYYIQLLISYDDCLDRHKVLGEFIENWFVQEVANPIMKTIHLPDVAVFNCTTAYTYLDQNERDEITSYLAENLTVNSIEFFGHQQQDSLENWIINRMNDDKSDIIILLDVTPTILYHSEYPEYRSLAEQWMDEGNMIIWVGYRPFSRSVTPLGYISDYSPSLHYILDGTSDNMGRQTTSQYLTSQGAEYIPSLGTSVDSYLFSSGGCVYRTYLRNDWKWDAIFSQSSDGNYYDNFVLKGSRGGYYAQFLTTSTDDLKFPQIIEEFIENYFYSKLAHVINNRTIVATPHNYTSTFTSIFNMSDVVAMRFHFNNITLAQGDNVSFFDSFGHLLGNISYDVTDFWTPWFYTNYVNLTLLLKTTGNAWGFEIDRWQMRYLPIIRYNSTNGCYYFNIFVDDSYWIGNKNATLTITDSEGVQSVYFLQLETLQQGPYFHNTGVNTLEVFKRNETLTIYANITDNKDISNDITAMAYLTDPYGNITTVPLLWVSGTLYEGYYVFPDWAHLGTWTITFNATDSEKYWTPAIPEQLFIHYIQVNGFPAEINDILINTDPIITEDQTIILQDQLTLIQVNATTDYYTENSTVDLRLLKQCSIPDVAIFASSIAGPNYISVTERNAITAYLIEYLDAVSVTVFDYTSMSQSALIAWMTERMSNNHTNILIILDVAPEQIFWDESYAEQWLEAGNALIYTGGSSWNSYITTGAGWGDNQRQLSNLLDLPSDIDSDYYRAMTPTTAAYTWLPSMSTTWSSALSKDLSYITNEWQIEEIFARSDNYSDSFVIKHSSGGYYAQFYCKPDDSLPRDAVIEEFLNFLPLGTNFKVIEEVYYGTFAPEVAIFTPSVSGPNWLTVSKRQTIANYLKDNINSLEVSLFDYNEQDQLISWMVERIDNGYLDILVILEIAPEQIYWDESYAEQWLEAGNALIYTGSYAWSSYVKDDGSTYYWDHRLDELLDLQAMDWTWSYDMSLKPPAYEYLPSMTSSWYSSCAKDLMYVKDQWSVGEMFASYVGTSEYTDAFAIRHTSGGYFAQFYCQSDDNLPRETVIEEFIENWLIPRAYQNFSLGYTLTNTTGWTSPSLSTENTTVILSQENAHRFRLYFSELDLLIGHNLTILDQKGNILLEYNYLNSSSNFWSPWIYAMGWLNVTIVRNSPSKGFNITKYQADIIPTTNWNTISELFETQVLFAHDYWNGTYLFEVIFQDIYGRSDNEFFNATFNGLLNHIQIDIPSICIRAAPQYFNLTVMNFTLLNPEELIVEFSIQRPNGSWNYQLAEVVPGTDLFVATYLFEVLQDPMGFYDVYVNVTSTDGQITTYFKVGTFEMINAAPFIHELLYSSFYIDTYESQTFTLNTSDAEDLVKTNLIISAHLILPSGVQEIIVFTYYPSTDLFNSSYTFITDGPYGQVFIYINVTDTDGATSYYQDWFVYGSIPPNITLVKIIDDNNDVVDESLGSYPFTVLVEVYDPDNTTHIGYVLAITEDETVLNVSITLDTINGDYTYYLADFSSLPDSVIDNELIRMAAYISDYYTLSNTNGSFVIYIPSIIYPINHSAINQRPFQLTWNGNEPLTTLSYFEVWVDGIWDHTLSITGDIVDQTSLTLNQGMYNISLIAFDQFGNNLSSMINVTIDLTPPSLTILDPVPMFNTTESTVLVNWTASDDYTGLTNFTLSYDAIFLSFDPSTIQYELSLVEGRYDLYLIAWDKAGNNNTAIITLTRDTTQPSISITHPSNNTYQNTSSLLIQWIGLDYQTGIHHYEVYVDASFIDTFKATNTSHQHDFLDGLHNTTIIAFDYMGWSSTTFHSFWIDTQPPDLSVSPSVKNYFTSDTTLSILWAASDAVGSITVYLYIDGNQSILTISPSDVTLSEGNHTIRIVARDQAQNENSTTFWVYVDTTFPVINAYRIVTNSSTYNYFWDAFDLQSGLNQTEIYVNGTLYHTLYGSGTSITFTDFNEGYYVIRINVFNNAGLNVSVTANYYVDFTPPVVRVSGVSDNDFLVGQISISCNVDDLTQTNISISINGETFYPDSWDGTHAEFSIDTTDIDDDHYTLRVNVIDEVGHHTLKDFDVAIDNDKANIRSFEHDPSTPTHTDNVTVSVTIYDAVGIDESSVILYWKLDSEDEWHNITMTLVTSSDTEWEFEAVIPPQAQGEEILYYITVTDLQERVTESDEESYVVEETPPDVLGPLIGAAIIIGILGALAGAGIYFGPRYIKPLIQKQLEKAQEAKTEEVKTRIDDLFDFEVEE